MKVIVPVEITDALLVGSTVAEPDATATGDGAGATIWAPGTTYAAGARVVRLQTHRVYESVDNGNVGNVPENTLGTTPPRWLDLGNTNRWRMLRANGSRPTVAASPLEVNIIPGRRVNTLAIPNVKASSILVEQYDGNDVLVRTFTQPLQFFDPIDWGEYFFGEWEAVNAVYVDGLVPISGGRIRIVLTRGVGNVECGPVVLGNPVDIGSVEIGAKVGALDFSKVERDAFGNALLLPRRVVPTTSQRLLVEAGAVDRITRALNELRARVALWVGIDNAAHPYFQSLFVLGLMRRFDFSHDLTDRTYLTLDLEGF